MQYKENTIPKANSGWGGSTNSGWGSHNNATTTGWGNRPRNDPNYGWGANRSRTTILSRTKKSSGWGIGTGARNTANVNYAGTGWGNRPIRPAPNEAARNLFTQGATTARPGYTYYRSNSVSSTITKIGDYNFKSPPHIFFSKQKARESESLSNFLTSPNQSQMLFLLNPIYEFDVFQYIPRNFTITSDNESFLFNSEFLKDSSSTIRIILKATPDLQKYELKHEEMAPIMKKLEQLYLGQMISFDIGESIKFRQIVEELGISNAIKNTRSQSGFGIRNLYDQIYPILSNLHSFLRENYPKTFIIATKNKEYNCNSIGIHSSKVIHEFIIQNPTSNRFEIDFEDEFNEFQIICDFFNFNLVQLSTGNMNSVKSIVEELQINIVLDNVNNFIDNYEKRIQMLDEQQSIIDSIDELFETLYKIKEITVDLAKEKIIDSNWIKTEEEVQELVAFILQVIQVDFILHPYLADLIEILNKEADDSNELKILVPFLTKKLMAEFGRSNIMNSFIFLMCQKGFIKKEEIKEKLIKATQNLKFSEKPVEVKKVVKPISGYSSFTKTATMTTSSNKLNLLGESYSFFIPELYEVLGSDLNKLLQCFPEKVHLLIKSYFPDNIDNFLKMREKGEPDDLLTKSLRNDDVSTFQSIVAQSQSNSILNSIVPYNLFENSITNGSINYINYAAAYGALKCFKYLILNHVELDPSSFSFAVFGGNNEIIKIIDQKSTEKAPVDPKNPSKFKKIAPLIQSTVNNLYPAISKHEDELFDWILEQKFPKFNDDMKLVINVINHSCSNGNSHAITTIIDKGFDFMKLDLSSCGDLIQKAAKSGFYTLLDFLVVILNEKLESCPRLDDIFNSESSVLFGNLSIFKLFYEKAPSMNLNQVLNLAIINDYKNIVEYIFENLTSKINLTQESIEKLFSSAINGKNYYIFNYMIEQFMKIDPSPLLSFDFTKLLSEACYTKNVEIGKKITEQIIEEQKLKEDENFDTSGIDLSLPFFNAAFSGCSELCQFFIDQKVYINYKKLSYQIASMSSINKEILEIIIKNIDDSTKEMFLNLYLTEVIAQKNKSFIEFVLKEKKKCLDFSLFDAIKTDDIDIVNMILDYNSDPKFVNLTSDLGTALNLAVKNGNLEIVKRLLKVPGIDPSLYELNNKTPLINAIVNLNIDITNAILEFYGDEIKNQAKQLDMAIIGLIEKISNKNSQPSKNSQLFMTNKFVDIIKRLSEIESANLGIYTDRYSLLSYACESNAIEIAQILINNKNVDLNSYSPYSGATPLITSINNNHIEIAKLLIQCERTDINKSNYNQQTPLILAVTKNFIELIDLIINDKRFNPVESKLDYAFYLSDGEISKKLIAVDGIDVNYRYIVQQRKQNNRSKSQQQRNYGYSRSKSSPAQSSSNNMIVFDSNSDNNNLISTPLINNIRKYKTDIIDLIITHPSFDPIKSQTIDAIFIACEKQDSDIFEKLIKLINNSVNIFDDNGTSLLQYAIGTGLKAMVTQVLSNESFNMKKKDFIKAFVTSLTSKFSSFDIVNEIIEFDSKHNHFIDFKKCLPQGKSYFTVLEMNTLKINQIIKFLIENGADPNMPDKFGVYPLEYAIKSSRINFIVALISSEKIDYSIKLGKDKKSYLHLAAVSKKEILAVFLKNKVMDINITDANGMTPLMDVCKYRDTEKVRMFFNEDNLDYLKCNNDGDDVLKMCQKMYKKEINPVTDKKEFLSALIETFRMSKNASNRANNTSNVKKEASNENKEKDNKKDENEKSDENHKKDNDEHEKEEVEGKENEKDSDEKHDKENDEEKDNENEKIEEEEEEKENEKSDNEDEDEEHKKSDNEDEDEEHKKSDNEKSDDDDENEKSDDDDNEEKIDDEDDEESKPFNKFAKLDLSKGKYQFGLKKPPTSFDSKPTFVSKDAPSITKPSSNSSVQDRIVAAVCETLNLESLTQEQAKMISEKLSEIAQTESKKVSQSSSFEQKQSEEEKKIQNRFVNQPRHQDENKEKEEEESEPRFRRRTDLLQRRLRRNDEFDDYYQNSSYENQMFQSQWNQVMQMNNMRNVHFSMILQQQQQMLGMLGSANTTRSQSKKRKRKSHK